KADAAKQKSAIAAAQKKMQSATKSLAAAEKKLKTESDSYTSLSPIYPSQSTGRRKALAEWIASNNNPLTARVAVNHIWMRHFGRPLVESVFDFGRSGKKPTHPQLLDWLADELIKSGWSMKHLHRLIVTSNTFRLASAIDDDVQSNLAVDSDNRYWWRFERRRLEAEAIRDSVLYASGQLDLTLGGPELENNQGATSSRRSLYYVLYPTAGGTMKFMELFNPPNPADCYRRRESIVPQQALGMVNGNITQNQARLLARKLSKTIAASQPDPAMQETEFINQSYEQILTRSPSTKEFEMCREFLQKQIQLFQKTDPKQYQATVVKGVTPASTDPIMRSRESLVRVLFNHHDFVTIP
ncbi:MAG: DUF1553 domain-containing protein, partial [Planctomycetes bacterium]|nr:DUF1553 domain-containing protein [Planctomycetota bacterium]